MRRANLLLPILPHFRTRPPMGFRTICSGSLGFKGAENNSREQFESGRLGFKVAENNFRERFEIGPRFMKCQIPFEIGSWLMEFQINIDDKFPDTVFLATKSNSVPPIVSNVQSIVCCAEGDADHDFLPLTVYYEDLYQTHHFREIYLRQRLVERAIYLRQRLVERAIRPLFPPGFYNEVQIHCRHVKEDPNVDVMLAANVTSAALMLSDIPWDGPIGIVRIGRTCGEFIVNPTVDELTESDLNLVYACTKDKTLMVDVQAHEISEKDLEAGLRFAHKEAVKYIEPQIRLVAKDAEFKKEYKSKKEYKLSILSDRTLEKVRSVAGASDEEVRKRVITEGYRVDGRKLDEVRPLYYEAGYIPQLHGSALFSHGKTMVHGTVTLSAPTQTKRFMLHCSFPPFFINEVGKHAGLNRLGDDIDAGTLAEKALLAVLPPEDDFPYTIHVNSDVFASDGSTSMATVCGSSLALMNAGIPLREHVAGVSMGIVSELDPSSGEITDYRILTDIMDLEDHLGDIDFKIAGTRKGVTATQLDIKSAGIPLDIICECLEPAHKARLQILDHMEQIDAPRLFKNDEIIIKNRDARMRKAVMKVK